MKMIMIITMPGTRIKIPIAIREMCHPSRRCNVQAVETREEKIVTLKYYATSKYALSHKNSTMVT